MSDDQDIAQEQADKALEEAIQQAVSAYSIAPDGAFLLNNFILVANGRVFNEDGETRIYFKVLKDGGLDFNWDEGLGMLRRAHRELEAEFSEDGDQF